MRVRPGFFLVTAILVSGRGPSVFAMEWAAVVFVSILFHELGHAIVARRLGYKPWIELYAMGGLTHWEPTEETASATWRGDLAIALAGPGAGFLFGGATWLASRAGVAEASAIGARLVSDLLWVNIGWGLVNLLPILPYDGGLALAAVARRLWPERASLPHTVTIAVGGTAVALTIWAGHYWLTYLAGQGVAASIAALRGLASARRLEQAWELWDGGDIPGARGEAHAALARTSDDLARARAFELLVLIELRAMRADAAKEAFEAYPETLTPSSLLRAFVALDRTDDADAAALLRDVEPALLERVFLPMLLAWARGGWSDRVRQWLSPGVCTALPPGTTMRLGAELFYGELFDLSAHVHEREFVARQSPDAAYNVACSHAKAGRAEEALTWLARAVDSGYEDIEHLDGDEDLISLRPSSEYASIRARLASGAPARVPSV